jgi:hypothetical protein
MAAAKEQTIFFLSFFHWI